MNEGLKGLDLHDGEYLMKELSFLSYMFYWHCYNTRLVEKQQTYPLRW